jgi:hypothetical protein
MRPSDPVNHIGVDRAKADPMEIVVRPTLGPTGAASSLDNPLQGVGPRALTIVAMSSPAASQCFAEEGY